LIKLVGRFPLDKTVLAIAKGCGDVGTPVWRRNPDAAEIVQSRAVRLVVKVGPLELLVLCSEIGFDSGSDGSVESLEFVRLDDLLLDNFPMVRRQRISQKVLVVFVVIVEVKEVDSFLRGKGLSSKGQG